MATRGNGRPPKLAQRIHPDAPTTYGDRIIQALEAGAFFDDACTFANVSRSAAYEWLARGKDARALVEERGDDAKLGKNDQLYLDFTDAVERARAGVVVSNLAIIRQAAQSGTWQAAAWYLERTQPQKFGRFQRPDTDEPTMTTDAARAKLLGLDLGYDHDE